MAYNQPTFSTCDRWKPDAITFANNSDDVVSNGSSIFIHSKGSIYATSSNATFIRIWTNGNGNQPTNISAGLNQSSAVFTHLSGDMYVDNGGNNRTEKWAVNSTDGVPVIYAEGGCHGLFIDIDDQIYCSRPDFHMVIKQSVMDAPNSWTIAAGNDTNGSDAYLLNGPVGIFVNTTFSLYIADAGNNRVQVFGLGQLNGTTVAGKGAPSTITLNDPCAVVLDGDGYLFIVDRGNHRIVASGPAGFRCIAGCTGSNGSALNQLSSPKGISLDSSGNVFVVDGDNQRIQKFLLAPNSCGKFSVVTSITVVV